VIKATGHDHLADTTQGLGFTDGVSAEGEPMLINVDNSDDRLPSRLEHKER
jgi:hypothetical protein